MGQIAIRPATSADSVRVFEWRNDPVTISTSRTQAGVDWGGHERWFAAQLANEKTVCLIGQIETEPFGVVWFREGRGGVWETSLNLSPKFRGRKLSTPILAAALDWMRKSRSAKHFSAEIHDSNIASITTFERCRFVHVYPSAGFGIYCVF